MSNELVKYLNKLADDLESAATIEAEIERANKIAHMISAINGLSILKEAAIGLEAAAMSNLYGQRANYPYQQRAPAPEAPTPRIPDKRGQSFLDKIRKGIKSIFPGKSDKINKIKGGVGEKINIRNLENDIKNSAQKMHVLRQTRSNLENQINLLAQQYREKLTEARRGNILAKHEADALRKELEMRSNTINNLQNQISTYETRIGLAQKTIGDLQKETQGLRGTLGTTGEHLKYTRATNKRLYDAMAKLTEENKALRIQAAMGSREAAKKLEENAKIINNLQKQIAVGETRLGLAHRTIGDLQSKVENLENIKKNLEARIANGEYAAARELEVVKNELAKNQKLIGALKSEKGIAEKMLASEKAKSLLTKFLESPLKTRALVAGVPLAALGLTGYGAYRLGKNKREGLLDRLGIN